MITARQLQERFSYNPDTGVITRKTDSHVRKWRTGMVAGSINGQGYREIKIDGKIVGAHRIAWMLYYGNDAPEFIDHINRTPADNRIANLRAATKSQNGANRVVQKNNTAGVKGCYFVPSKAKNLPGRWRVQCRVDNKLVNLGRYLTIKEAQEAYNKYAFDTFGEYFSPA